MHDALFVRVFEVTPEGHVKLLDFGLAKMFEEEPPAGDISNSPTLTVHAATRVGMILGTAAYMAPEQAKGKPVDRRADIWAFGVVLCEMLAGQQLFTGETAGEVLAAVMKDQPAIPEAPPAIRSLIERCLEKTRASGYCTSARRGSRWAGRWKRPRPRRPRHCPLLTARLAGSRRR